MPTTNIFEWYGTDGRPRPLRAARLSRLMLLAVLAYFFAYPALWAQTADSQTGDADKSWTATTESQSDNVNPTRTTESHTRNGNRTLDSQSIQRRGTDGHFEPYQDIEKETVKVDATTTRTTTRAFALGADGAKILVQITEEEKHTSAGGDSSVVRSISNPDINGKLQMVQRQVEETTKISKNVEDTKTTVMLPSVNGGLAPAMKVEERRTLGANNLVESQKTTLRPDGAGNWQVDEIRQATTWQGGKNRSTEERISRPDSDGKLGEISRTVSKESETASGEKRNTVETYSLDVPGSARDGGLHLVERSTTSQRTNSTGQQTTEQRVEQPNPGDPGSGLQVITLTTDTVRPSPSGAQATRTIQARDANGSLGVVSVDTTKSDNIHAIQVQIAPSESPK
ncbi:MAG TPA: hypothetical protein VK513_00240 [Terriglobales bacterium]|nr:hypothetical protein [Terriglobales bacterium]